MIITQLSGGLGNQMFIYAAGLSLAEHLQTVLKLDVTWYGREGDRVSHERYGLSCFNISEHLATSTEIERVLRPKPNRSIAMLFRQARKVGLGWIANMSEGSGSPFFESPTTEISQFFEQTDQTYLIGLWQSEAFFSPVAALLRRHFSFRFALPPSASSLQDQIDDDPSAVALHIRRGDFGKRVYQEHNQVLRLDYYYRALSLLESNGRRPSVYVFSDDPDWVAANFDYAARITFVSPGSDWKAFDELNLMSRCRDFVVANSTFSWWGAWLGQQPGKIVCTPDPWFATTARSSRGLVPASWLRVEAGW